MLIDFDDNGLTLRADTIVYAVSGRGAIVSDNGKKRQELGPGDFALIPAYVCDRPARCLNLIAHCYRLNTKKSMMVTRKLSGLLLVEVEVQLCIISTIGARAKTQQRRKAATELDCIVGRNFDCFRILNEIGKVGAACHEWSMTPTGPRDVVIQYVSQPTYQCLIALYSIAPLYLRFILILLPSFCGT